MLEQILVNVVMNARDAIAATSLLFTTKPVGAGSGLGLSSAYGAVVMMGGTIEIFGADPQGTHVRILLPAA